MKKMTVNFGNIVKELKNNDSHIFFRKTNAGGIYIENNIGSVYQMESYYYGSYLDKLIKDKTSVVFNKVDLNVIQEWEKEVWSIKEVKEFIERQRL